MGEKQPTEKTAAKRPIQILRERSGGPSEDLKQFVKEQQRVKKAIRAALQTGPKTVPEIAASSQIEASVVLWHLMALKRYGSLREDGQRGQYPLYALKEN